MATLDTPRSRPAPDRRRSADQKLTDAIATIAGALFAQTVALAAIMAALLRMLASS